MDVQGHAAADSLLESILLPLLMQMDAQPFSAKRLQNLHRFPFHYTLPQIPVAIISPADCVLESLISPLLVVLLHTFSTGQAPADSLHRIQILIRCAQNVLDGITSPSQIPMDVPQWIPCCWMHLIH
jgi:hypothetical protein